jgi:hypothetical protein
VVQCPASWTFDEKAADGANRQFFIAGITSVRLQGSIIRVIAFAPL